MVMLHILGAAPPKSGPHVYSSRPLSCGKTLRLPAHIAYPHSRVRNAIPAVTSDLSKGVKYERDSLHRVRATSTRTEGTQQPSFSLSTRHIERVECAPGGAVMLHPNEEHDHTRSSTGRLEDDVPGVIRSGSSVRGSSDGVVVITLKLTTKLRTGSIGAHD